jgi:hypothetical protein
MNTMNRRRYTVSDISFSKIQLETYDVAIYCSGYEARCTHLYGQLDQGRSKSNWLVQLPNPDKPDLCIRHDGFDRNPELVFLRPDINCEQSILHVLNSAQKSAVPLRVLVDYSSMPRRLFAIPLLWSLWASGRPIQIDYAYSLGTHISNYTADEIEELVCMPGCEGRQRPNRRSIAIFGFGFEGVSLETAYNMLEVDELRGFVFSPGAFPDYESRAIAANESLINEIPDKVLWKFPLRSVEETYRFLLEFVADSAPQYNISILPAGPKPGVLASLLVCLRNTSASCLAIKYAHPSVRPVTASGEVVVTRVAFQ